MSDAYSLTFHEAHLRVVLEIANAALADAKRRNVDLPLNDEDARQLLVRRIILAIESGETDIPNLRELALHPGLGPNQA
jgi:hypothetical protein